jgi:hypothetical protein
MLLNEFNHFKIQTTRCQFNLLGYFLIIKKKKLCGLAKRQVDEKALLQGNPVLVEKMLDNVFRCQPAFESDVTKSLSAMADATTKTVEKIETSIRFSNCDDENAVEAIVDLVTYATGNNVTVIT